MKLLPYAKKLRDATGVSVSVMVEAWAHSHGNGTTSKISISFVPGLGSSRCDQEEFTSLATFKARADEIINGTGKDELDTITDTIED